MVNVRADAEREVDALRLKSCDLFAQQIDRCCVVLANTSEQLFITFIAAEDGVRQIKEDNGCLSEECVALVLLASLRHRFASCGGNGNGAWIDYALSIAGVA
jgi:hypothetical protein